MTDCSSAIRQDYEQGDTHCRVDCRGDLSRPYKLPIISVHFCLTVAALIAAILGTLISLALFILK